MITLLAPASVNRAPPANNRSHSSTKNNWGSAATVSGRLEEVASSAVDPDLDMVDRFYHGAASRAVAAEMRRD
jgi:hypothetical protein